MEQGDKGIHKRYSEDKGTQRKLLMDRAGKGILGRRNSLCKGSKRGTLPAGGHPVVQRTAGGLVGGEGELPLKCL